ncbi:MAG: MFS transporter, partial [Hydrogenophaga sp.]|nr:MFS transporter [Hydrogenophaga sp.]
MAPEAALPVLATAGFASMLAMRMCDAMLPALGQSFATPAAQTSATVSGFAIAYGVMQLVAGPLGDRFGKPRVIALAALLCGLFALGAAAAPSLSALVAGRALMGGAAAGIIPLTMAWVGDHVPWERRQVVLARLLAYTVGGMTAGAWAGGVMADTLG